MDKYIYNQLKNIISSFFEKPEEILLDSNFLDQYPVGSFFEANNIAFIIIDNMKVEIVSQSRNFNDVLGITNETLKQDGVRAIIKNIAPEHLDFFKITPECILDYWNGTKLENRKNVKRQSIGLRYRHITKGEIRLSLPVFILQMNAKQQPTYLFSVIQDITHFMKDDFYWFRIFCEDEPERIVSYRSDLKVIEKSDIISKREKEILRLMIDGYDSDKIAKTLFISKITVNNHRQNILNKVGARDTTALISLAKLCNLV